MERRTYRCSYCEGTGRDSNNSICGRCSGTGYSDHPPHVQEGREFGSNFPW